MTFDFLRDANANRLVVVGVAIVVGVGGVFFLYWAMNRVVDLLPERYPREGSGRTSSSGPALVILSVFLVYPVINTICISFKDAARRGVRRPGQLQVRLHRPEHAPRDPQHGRLDRSSSRSSRVSIGLAFATLADRLRRGEAVAKSMIFLPMAISFAGRVDHVAAHLQLPARRDSAATSGC